MVTLNPEGEAAEIKIDNVPSFPNLGTGGSTGCTGMGRHVMRPRIAGSESTRPTCPLAERTGEHRRGAVRAAGANGEAARL